MAEINSIFDYIFPRKKASDYQQTNLLDYGESPESQNVYNPGQGDFGVMSLEGLKNSIPATVAGTLDFMYDSAGTLRRPDFQQVQDNVEPGDFNIYNAYAGTDKFQPFTTSFRQTGLLPSKEEEEAFRQRSLGYDLGKYGGQFLLGGMGVRSATGKSLGEAMNFAIPGLTLDLEDPNIGDALDAIGMDNEFQQFLQGNIDENSSAGERLKQRFTNVLGEFGINVVADTAINTLRVAKNLYKDPEYREQAIKNIGRDMYGDLPGSQLFPGMRAKGADKKLARKTRNEYKKINESDLAPEVKEAQRQQLWEKTGWWQAEDGNMHFEISDKDSVFTPPTEVFPTRRALPGNKRGIRGLKLGDVFKHDKLYELYPFMKNTPVEFHVGYRNKDGEIITGDGARASASWGKPKITLSVLDDPNNPMGFIFNDDVRSDVLHEVQHLIQEYEKFTMGSSGIDALRIQLLRDYAKYADNPEEYKLNLAFSEIANYNQELRQLNKVGDLSYNNPEEALKVLKNTDFWRENGSAIKDWMINNYGTDKPNSDQMFNFYQRFIEGDNGQAVTNARLIQNVYNQFDEDMMQTLNQGASAKSIKEHTDTILNAQKQRLESGADISQDELNLMEMLKDLNSNSAEAKHRVYLNMLGEQQARDVQQSLGIPDEELAKLPPGQRFIRETGLETDSTAVTSQKAIQTGNRGFSDDTESLYNLRGILGGEANQNRGFSFNQKSGKETDSFKSDKVAGLKINEEYTGLMGEKYVDYDLMDLEGMQFYPRESMTFGKVRMFYNSEGKIESISPPKMDRTYAYNYDRQKEAISEFFEGLKETENTNKQIVIREIPRNDIEKYRALGVKFDGYGDPYKYEIATGKIRPGEMDIEAFKNFRKPERDEAGFFLRSEKILNESKKDTWKNPDEVFMEGKKGKSGLLKDVPKQELEETGVLDYLAKAKAEGKPVTKKGLLDQLEDKRPYLGKSEAYYVNENMDSGLDDYQFSQFYDELPFEDSYSAYRGEDYQIEILNDVSAFIERYREEYDALAETPIGIEFEVILPKLGKESYALSLNDERIVKEYAEDIARIEYEKNPEYYINLEGDWSHAPQISVQGNEDVGFRAFDNDLAQYITDEEYNLNELQVQINDYLNQNYLDYMPIGGVNETFWKDYASPGYFDDSTYKEINAEVSQSDLQFPRNVNQHSLPGDEDRSLFFTRTTQRAVYTPEDGRVTALHIDEIQSDWHQQLRKFGIDPEEATKKGQNAENALKEMMEKRGDLATKVTEEYNNVAEFKMTFIEDIIDQDPFLRQHKDMIENVMMKDFGRAGTTLKTFVEDIQPKIKGDSYNAYMDAKTGGTTLRKDMGIDVMKALSRKVSKMLQKEEAQYKQVKAEKQKAEAVIRKLEKFINEAPGRTSTTDLEKDYIGVGGSKPPLANEKWEETALKMNIMDAIDRNLDYVVWTPSDVQIAQWGDASAELYKNVYDKRLPKNAKKFVNEFGGELLQGHMDYGSYKDLGQQGVWIIKITPEMKKNLTKQGGMPLYQYGAPVPFGLLGMENQDNGRIDENKGLLQ